MTAVSKTDTPLHALPAELDLAKAESLLAMLQEACTRESGIVLNGSEVVRVSTACLQVLMAARNSAQTHHIPFSLEQPSPVLEAALHDLGLASVLTAAPT